MQTHLIYGKMSNLWKYIAYEEELKPEVKALQEKLQNCKILMDQKVEWKEIKRIIGMGRSTYFRYKNLKDGYKRACRKIKKTEEIQKKQNTRGNN